MNRACTALTTIWRETTPVGPTELIAVCSLRTTVPRPSTGTTVLGAGVVVGGKGCQRSMPPSITVAPVTPRSSARHELAIVVAVAKFGPRTTSWTSARASTNPAASSPPKLPADVATANGPVEKRLKGNGLGSTTDGSVSVKGPSSEGPESRPQREPPSASEG